MALVQIADTSGRDYLLNTDHVVFVLLESTKGPQPEHSVRVSAGDEARNFLVDSFNLKKIVDGANKPR